jgi:cytochrome c oxidase subunit III
MTGAPVIDDLEILPGDRGPRGPSSSEPPYGPGGGGGGRGGDGQGAPHSRPARSQRVYYTGIWLALAAILMFFMALVSAYLVRKGTGSDWRAVALPRVVWLNTAVLLLSSIALEASHRAWERDQAPAFRAWWATATALGLFFLGGQYVAWRQLAAAGVYLASNPSSSFFYLLTAAHGLHLAGGLAALLYVLSRGWIRLHATAGVAAEVASIYWHFMDGLWVFLLLVLTLGR